MSPTVRTILTAVGCAAAAALCVSLGTDLVRSDGATAASEQRRVAGTTEERAFHDQLAQLSRAVHAEAILPTGDGKFAEMTFDRGEVVGVAGDAITLREGSDVATYRTVMLPVPADAEIRVDRKRATLADIDVGDRAVVVRGPRRTLVLVGER